MTEEEFKKLDTGDIVRLHHDGASYVVTFNYGGHVTAVRTMDMTNPREWQLVSKVEKRT